MASFNAIIGNVNHYFDEHEDRRLTSVSINSPIDKSELDEYGCVPYKATDLIHITLQGKLPAELEDGTTVTVTIEPA